MTHTRTPRIHYPSRRSVVHSTHGMVACTQPLAAQAGIRILKEGGNAADAAVAVAAVLGLTEPSSTGIGGDCFCLYYNPETHHVHSLNASGRSPAALTLEHALKTIPAEELQKSQNRIPHSHAHAVTVPGAAAGWCDTVEKFGSGKLTLEQILAPAIEYAEEGFPVCQISAELWTDGESILKKAGPNFGEILKNGNRAPREGELMTLPGHGRTYRLLGKYGRKGFYEGKVAEEIVKAVQERGGVLNLEDLKRHGEIGSEEMEPISLEIPWGVEEGLGLKRVWECAPNGQGMVALQTLGILEALENKKQIPKFGEPGGYQHNSVEYLHAIISALRIAFADAGHYIRDPSPPGSIPLQGLLSKDYLLSRSKLFDPTQAGKGINHGEPPEETQCDTVYFSVADNYGGGCSFINSIFTDFGSGIIPKSFSFPLQNRGAGFTLSPSTHPNVLAPNKRPYHTIIPAMLTTPLSPNTPPASSSPPTIGPQKIDTIFGVMGGYMQPQGHVQVLLNMLAYGMSPQEALDAPRICIGPNYTGGGGGSGSQSDENKEPKVLVNAEAGIPQDVITGLEKLGYLVRQAPLGEVDLTGRGIFGRGQIIRVREADVDCPDQNNNNNNNNNNNKKKRCFSGASDMRGDGHAVGY